MGLMIESCFSHYCYSLLVGAKVRKYMVTAGAHFPPQDDRKPREFAKRAAPRLLGKEIASDWTSFESDHTGFNKGTACVSIFIRQI
jgi:hypothetical protein